MLVGFVHGVMNTDNMTISGETIDYGPCAFMEAYDPATVFSSIDHGGRYAYGNQPVVAEWNLARLAEALLPLFADDQDEAVALAMESLGGFRAGTRRRLVGGHARQAGAANGSPMTRRDAAGQGPAHRCCRQTTSTTRRSSARSGRRREVTPSPRADCSSTSRLRRLADALARADPDADAMDRVNPVYIPRNHLVEEALAARPTATWSVRRAPGGRRAPFDERPGPRAYAAPAPDDFGEYQTFCGT